MIWVSVPGRNASRSAGRPLMMLGRFLLVLTLVMTAGLATSVSPTRAQNSAGALGFGTDDAYKPTPGAQMLLESDQLVYDYDLGTVAAVGGVKIYYDGYTLEAQKVTYDQKKKTMVADGNVKIVDRTGVVIEAQHIDITQDFADGFVQSLRLDTPQRTHFAAEKAIRKDGDTTTFYRGVYTACEPCRERPDRAPVWQVRAQRIIVDHNEKMIFFRSARLEFLGLPVAYIPAFSAPDPSVKRKSGFLYPSSGYQSALGGFLKVPYFWALAPNYDVTFSPAAYTRQGVLLDALWRQRLDNGSYTVEAAGIHQEDPEAFYSSGTRNSGVTDDRGGIRTTGAFMLNRLWTLGWDATTISDRTFTRDYKVLYNSTDVAISQFYLTGQSKTNYFDMRGYYFRVLTNDSGLEYDQGRQPVVAPVADQNYIFDKDILGGQLTMTNNVTSLTRDETDCVDSGGDGLCRPGDAILGLKGNFNRASTNWTWQTQQIGPGGLVVKPFAYMRADAFYLSQDEPILNVDDNGDYYRAMPAAGVELRWPVLATGGAASLLIEPIGQIIVRPNEQDAGTLPNEDAQSLVFDDSSLFDWDKFSGYDRIEGGTRANVGFRYAAELGAVATISGIVGESYQIAGLNSFAVQNLTETGSVSGLETAASDYVGSMTLDAGAGYFLTARGRFDSQTFDVNQAQLTATSKMGNVTTSASYLYLREQPAIASSNSGTPTDTISGKASWQFTENWRLFGSIGWDFQERQMAANSLGIAYDDECTTFSIAYSEVTQDYTDLQTSRSLLVNLQLRTLGGTQFSSNFGNTSN